jgi:acetyl esterase/lipase
MYIMLVSVTESLELSRNLMMACIRSTVTMNLLVAGCWLASGNPAVAQQQMIKLWPGDPPGRIATQGQEADTTPADGRKVAGKSVIRLGNVSSPMLTIYSPPADKNTGAAVMVCPGGGYNILAYDLEGTEVCELLNSIGVTGVLLKYRVPSPKGHGGASDARPLEPLQDAQRAMGILREKAALWNIDPKGIGVLGFSAGGNLAARLSTNYAKRLYPAVDDADALSCRPDFAILIYPAYLFEKGSDELIAADLPVSAETPPTFMTMAFDDGVGPENILRYALALKKVEVPVEVHLYPTGGHGFGLRKTDDPVTSWPKQCAAWLQGLGWLTK